MKIRGFTNSASIERSKLLIRSLIRGRGRERFIESMPSNGTLIDVGCGNNSPFKIKSLRPDITYIGIDVGAYNQTEASAEKADKYIVVTPDGFDAAIASFEGTADAVVSSHNIEHCDYPDQVIIAMCKALKPGGSIYLSFPCEASVNFPSRYGCLNYYDHEQHKELPRFDNIIKQLRDNGLTIEFSAPNYRPPIAFLIGAVFEPYSSYKKRVLPLGLTWSYYGFETVIWARKRV